MMIFRNLENAKRKAHLIKWRCMENLDKLLPEFESHALSRGIKVVWANDELEARSAITDIIQQSGAQTFMQSASTIHREIGLDECLRTTNIQPVEGNPKRTKVDIGITGADFIIAENGSVAISTPNGVDQISYSATKTHIVIAGIDKIIPTMRDLDLFWPLLSTHRSGEQLETLQALISGPSQANETDGPKEMVVILLDNGRSNLLEQEEQRQGLYCIDCEACLRVCPVYQHLGEDGYESTRTGPIGSLITPHTQGMKEFKHLSEKSTLCGKCDEVCPVSIDISRMLLLNRRDAVNKGHVPTDEKLLWKSYTVLMSNRRWLDRLSAPLKNLLLRLFLKKKWGKKRVMPKVAKKAK